MTSDRRRAVRPDANFARVRSVPVVVIGIGLVSVVVARAGPEAGLPVGILTATQPPPVPLVALEPALMAICLSVGHWSRMGVAEAVSARRIGLRHASTMLGCWLWAALLLVADVRARGFEPVPALAALAGYAGLAALGSALLPRFGGVVVAAFVGLLMVGGYGTDNTPAWWAGPLAETTEGIATWGLGWAAVGVLAATLASRRSGRDEG